MDLQLEGKVGIITGASRGIGKAIALALSREGVRLALVARSEGGLQAVSNEIAADQQPLLLAGDLTAAHSAQEIIEAVVEHFGALHILVNNTGASLGGDIQATKRDDLKASFEINVEIPFALAKYALPYMRRQKYGRVVMLSSIYGREAGGKIPYNAAKAAEISLTKSLAREVASDGVTVNNVAPGSIRYAGGSWDKRVIEDPTGMREWVKRELPLGRFGRAEEIANVVAFICSPMASLVNGASIAVDGGQGRSNL